MRKLIAKKNILSVLLSLVLGFSALGLLLSLNANHIFAAGENLYVIPVDGYYKADGTDGLKVDDGGCSIWLSTNEGINASEAWQGLSGGQDVWWGPETESFKFLDTVVLINGKTFTELNAEGAGLARYTTAYFGTGKLCLRIHTDGSLKVDGTDANAIKSITLKKGFQFINNASAKLGQPMPEDITMNIIKLGNKYMAVKATTAATVSVQPTKTVYGKNETLDLTGLKLAVTYSGKTEATIIDYQPEMIVTTPTFTGEEDATKTAVLNVNGITVNVDLSYQPNAVKTISSIAVKEGSSLNVEQYSQNVEIGSGSLLTVTFSDSST